MKLGIHVSIAGKIYEAVDRARALGCDTMQIFSRNPRSWQAAKLVPDDIKEFTKRRKQYRISPLYVHIPYLINLTSPEDRLWEKSIQSYIEDIKRADALEAEYFVTHLGSHKGKGEEFGINRFADGMNEAIAQAKPKLKILLETTAGTGNSLGYKFEHIQGIIQRIKEKRLMGVCLDTCHVYAAGYDIATKKGLDETLQQFDKLIGLNRLGVIHINDSQASLGSRIDRHEHIGKGKIGPEGFKLILKHPRLRNLAFILETPKKDPKFDPMNLATVRKLAVGA